MIRYLAPPALLVLAACSPAQIKTAQADQAVIQAILNAGCSNPVLEAALSAAIPGGSLGCVGAVAGSAIVTTVMNDPALIAQVQKVAAQAK